MTDLASAIAAAESLVDYKGVSEGSEKKQVPAKDKAKEDQEGSVKQSGKSMGHNFGCFICNGSHRARDCPKKERVASIIAEGEEVPRVDAVQMVTALTHQGSAKRELMFVSVKLNGHEVPAMIDTGATDNFISVDCAKRCGLSLVKVNSRVKAVNSEAQPVAGVAKNVGLDVGGWRG